jgi:pimeloyl-ACP methyl ester carboxylesterase
MQPRIAAFVCLCLLAGCGGDDGDTPPPGRAEGGGAVARTFDVDGRAMYLECRGEGSPVVVLEAGLGVAGVATWAGVQHPLAETTRTCWYDRAGIGRSAPAEPPRTSPVMVEELRALLDAAGVAPPYVLAGASFGGLNAQLMAREHPDDVVGLVLLDALHPDFDARFEAVMGRRAARDRAAMVAQNPEGVRFEDQLASDAAVRDSAPLPPIPLRVLVHGDAFEPGGEPVPRLERLWRRLQRDLAAQSPEGTMEIVPGTTHRIAEDDPAAVVAAVRAVVVAAAP